MTAHNFDDSLAYSHEQADRPWWESVYRRAFPDMVSFVDLRNDGWHQRAGRDRAVILSSGRAVYVDEKVRSETYEDVLVEVWSVYPKGAAPPYRPASGTVPGWACKALDCDWLAYAFVPSQTCYLFPFLGVRAAVSRHLKVWIEQATQKTNGFRWVVADNRRYNTISIAVPIWLLQDAVADALTISWRKADA